MSAATSPLASALALAFAHGPLAGTASTLAAEREGSLVGVSVRWQLLEGSVAVEARGATLEACHDKVADVILRLWPELNEAANWL